MKEVLFCKDNVEEDCTFEDATFVEEFDAVDIGISEPFDFSYARSGGTIPFSSNKSCMAFFVPPFLEGGACGSPNRETFLEVTLGHVDLQYED